MNLAEEPLGLAYRIVPVTLDGIGPVPRLEWDSAPVTMTADEALAAQAVDGDSGGALQEAVAWLQGVLVDGPVKAVDVKKRAAAEGAQNVAQQSPEMPRNTLKSKPPEAVLQAATGDCTHMQTCLVRSRGVEPPSAFMRTRT